MSIRRTAAAALLAVALAPPMADAAPIAHAVTIAHGAPIDATPTPAPTPIAGATTAWSAKKLYRVSYASSPSPVPLLAIHSWTVTVVDAHEHPVDDARLTVLGGMPAHAHGLPTTPAVTSLGGGRYRVDGLKFHMPGAWVVAFRIKAKAGIDAVSFALDLP
jgi:hypothetical protein